MKPILKILQDKNTIKLVLLLIVVFSPTLGLLANDILQQPVINPSLDALQESLTAPSLDLSTLTDGLDDLPTTPGFGDDVTDVPIDGGLSLLVAAGVGYGAKQLRKKKGEGSSKL
jgi:hypothetical protein